jgi:hypothetical protein
MRVSFLELAGSNRSPHVNIVGLHLHVFEDAIVSLPDDHSHFVLVKRWGMNLMCGST